MASQFPLRAGSTPALGLLVIVLSALSCRGGQQPPRIGAEPESLEGCWTLEVAGPDGAGWDPVARRGVPPTVWLGSVRLDSATVPGSQPAYPAWSVEDGEQRNHPFRAWRFVGNDSLWVGDPNALAGHSLRVSVAADTLTGTLTTFTDVMGTEVPPPRSARLVRTACPAGAEEGS